jgi:hypothetical protein
VKEVTDILGRSKKTVIIENNFSGQFAALRAETGPSRMAISEHDGEPFEPKHIVAGIKEILTGRHVVQVLSTEPGWQTEHPTGTSGDWSGRLVGAAARST